MRSGLFGRSETSRTSGGKAASQARERQIRPDHDPINDETRLAWISSASLIRVNPRLSVAKNLIARYADAGIADSANGRTSIVPTRADGIRAAIPTASSRFAASIK